MRAAALRMLKTSRTETVAMQVRAETLDGVVPRALVAGVQIEQQSEPPRTKARWVKYPMRQQSTLLDAIVKTNVRKPSVYFGGSPCKSRASTGTAYLRELYIRRSRSSTSFECHSASAAA